jgi:hypothetical protein
MDLGGRALLLSYVVALVAGLVVLLRRYPLLRGHQAGGHWSNAVVQALFLIAPAFTVVAVTFPGGTQLC